MSAPEPVPAVGAVGVSGATPAAAVGTEAFFVRAPRAGGIGWVVRDRQQQVRSGCAGLHQRGHEAIGKRDRILWSQVRIVADRRVEQADQLGRHLVWQVTGDPVHPYARRLLLASPVPDPDRQAERRKARLAHKAATAGEAA